MAYFETKFISQLYWGNAVQGRIFWLLHTGKKNAVNFDTFYENQAEW